MGGIRKERVVSMEDDFVRIVTSNTITNRMLVAGLLTTRVELGGMRPGKPRSP